ncbi:MAG TPA: NADH dehydrogenase subunit [Myxococcota bacterium]
MRLHPDLEGRSLVDALRRGGVVGAGGAGFPTWAKLQTPLPLLVVNAQESEPGFIADKWLHRTYARELLDVLTHLRTQGCTQTIVAAKQKDRAWLEPQIQLAGSSAVVVDATGRNRPVPSAHAQRLLFAFTDDRYAFGMESALVMIVANAKIPPFERPSQHGIAVINSETLFNIHRLLSTGVPVVDKLVHVFGATPRHTLARVPIGTPASVVLEDAGVTVDDIEARGFVVVDGGPGWFTPVDPRRAVVTRRTNGLLVLDPAVVDVTKKDVFATKKKLGYPAEGALPPSSPTMLTPSVVRVPLVDNATLKGVRPALPCVQIGDDVVAGQTLAVADVEGFSVDVHASIAGTVVAVGDDGVTISAEAVADGAFGRIHQTSSEQERAT